MDPLCARSEMCTPVSGDAGRHTKAATHMGMKAVSTSMRLKGIASGYLVEW